MHVVAVQAHTNYALFQLCSLPWKKSKIELSITQSKENEKIEIENHNRTIPTNKQICIITKKIR